MVKFDREDRTAFGEISSGQCSTVLRDDSMGEREADAVALRFRREEGNEDLLKIPR